MDVTLVLGQPLCVKEQIIIHSQRILVSYLALTT